MSTICPSAVSGQLHLYYSRTVVTVVQSDLQITVYTVYCTVLCDNDNDNVNLGKYNGFHHYVTLLNK